MFGDVKGGEYRKTCIYIYVAAHIYMYIYNIPGKFFVTFLGWLSDPFKWLSDLQLGDEKVTLNHLVYILYIYIYIFGIGVKSGPHGAAASATC